MARPSTLKTRVRSILRESGASARQRARAGLAALAMVVAASICAAGIDPWNCEVEQPPMVQAPLVP